MAEPSTSLAASLVDLEAVNTDLWQNIPLPVKTSIAVMCRHVLILTSAHTHLETTVKSSSEALNTRLKKTAKTFNSQTDLLLSSQKRLSDYQEVLSKRLEAVSAQLREDVSVSIETERKDRENTKKDLEERVAVATGKLNGLQTMLNTAERELKAEIGSLKAITRYEIEESVVKPEVKTLTESVEEVSLAVKKLDKRLGAKIEALEDSQQRNAQAKIEMYEKSLEAALIALNKSPSNSAFSAEKLSETIEIALKPLKTDITALETQVNTENAQKQQEVTQLKVSFEASLAAIEAKVASSTVHLQSDLTSAQANLLNHLNEAKTDLLDLIEDKDKVLLSDQMASLASLEQRIAKQMEDFVASQVSEVRAKLAWLPLNLTDLKGMSPTEARLYTIEARLRNEENRRIQSIEKVHDKIAAIKPSFRRLHTSERPRTTIPDPVQTPSTLGTGGLDLDFRSMMSPGGMPIAQPRRHRSRIVKSDLAVQSVACESYLVPLVNPLDHTNSSQKEILHIYKEFSPAAYAGKLHTDKQKSAPRRVTVASRVSPELARSLEGSREGSPMRYLSLQQHELVDFQPIG